MSAFINRSLFFLAAIGVWLALPVQAADDYLSIIEAEADDTGAHSQDESVSPVRSAKKVRSVQDNQTIRPALGFDEFEAELGEFYSGTWFLYEKLTGEQRKTVFRAYQQDNRTAKVREAIVRQLTMR